MNEYKKYYYAPEKASLTKEYYFNYKYNSSDSISYKLFHSKPYGKIDYELYSFNEFEYDINGKKTKINIYTVSDVSNEDYTLFEYETYEYSPDGKLSKRITHHDSNLNHYEYEYDDIGNNIKITRIEFDEYWFLEYNQYNQLSTKSFFSFRYNDNAYTCFKKIKYIYDEYNKIKKIESYDGTGTILRSYDIFEYLMEW